MLLRCSPATYSGFNAPACRNGSACSASVASCALLPRQHIIACAQPVQDRESSAPEQEIENLDTNYCDDFVCQSSPAVEQAVRALAKDLEQPQRWTKQLFVDDVQYSGGMRSFRGFRRYKRHLFLTENVQKKKVTVERMRMAGLGTAVIDWRVQGTILKVLPVDVRVESTFELNMLTGRAMVHKDDWQLGNCSPLSAAVFTAIRGGWALRQKMLDVKEDSDELFERLQNNQQGPEITEDPTDPNKFFLEDDTMFKDAVLFASVLALFWLFFKAQYLVAEL